MSLSSIMAIQLYSYYGSHQLSLHARERLISMHYGAVLLHAAAQYARVYAHYLYYVPQSTGSLYCFVILFLQQASGTLQGNLSYPGHCGNDNQKINTLKQRY